MIKDPLTTWDGGFPYDVLAGVGVDPSLPHRDMMQVSFDLMLQGLMTPAARRAWNELRSPDRRLLIDFMLYDVDLDAGLAAVRAAIERAIEEPGEPPEVAEILQPGRRLLAELAEELPAVEMAPLPELPVPPDLAGGPSLALLDELIRFDR